MGALGLCSGQADNMGWILAKDGGSGGPGTGPLAVSPQSAVPLPGAPVLRENSCGHSHGVAASRQTSLLMEENKVLGDGSCGLEAGAVRDRVCFYLTMQGM